MPPRLKDAAHTVTPGLLSVAAVQLASASLLLRPEVVWGCGLAHFQELETVQFPLVRKRKRWKQICPFFASTFCLALDGLMSMSDCAAGSVAAITSGDAARGFQGTWWLHVKYSKCDKQIAFHSDLLTELSYRNGHQPRNEPTRSRSNSQFCFF